MKTTERPFVVNGKFWKNIPVSWQEEMGCSEKYAYTPIGDLQTVETREANSLRCIFRYVEPGEYFYYNNPEVYIDEENKLIWTGVE
jgi:hypothetical protein